MGKGARKGVREDGALRLHFVVTHTIRVFGSQVVDERGGEPRFIRVQLGGEQEPTERVLVECKTSWG